VTPLIQHGREKEKKKRKKGSTEVSACWKSAAAGQLPAAAGKGRGRKRGGETTLVVDLP